MKWISLLILFFSFYTGHGQNYRYVYLNSRDSNVNCYLIRFPETGKIRGLIVRDFSSLPDSSGKSRYKFQDLAAQNGIMTLYTVTSKKFPALYYDDNGPKLLDHIIYKVITDYNIPKQNIFIGGISASGTRALRYAQYCAEGKSHYGIKIKGVFSVDSPLDLERFYHSAKWHRHNFKDGMLWEANLILKTFPKYLGGTPEDTPESYRRASVYSATDSTGGNVRFYKNLPILFFHEPDIGWWIDERGATYFDINSYDIAGFVNTLKLMGNKNVELVTTSGKGFDHQGNRNCHSWTIVDENYLIHWILDHMD